MPAQAGRDCACPKCGAMNTVPVDDATSTPRAKQSQPRERREIPVVCSLCSTRMYATAAQIGSEIECPDCGTLNEVEKPPEPKRAGLQVAPPPEDGEEYQLLETDQPTHDSKLVESHFAFFCRLCSTQMKATADDVGDTVRCPDCESEMVVPSAPSKSEAKPLVDEGPDVVVGAEEDIEPAELMEHEKIRVVDDAISAPAGLRRDYGFADDPEPPKHPFVSRVLTFLFYRTTRMNWVMLGLTVGPLLYVLGMAIVMSHGGTVARGASLLIFVPAFLFSVVWSGIAAACHLQIINETAAGNDEIIEWPNVFDYTGWLGGAFYGINAMAVAVIPATLITKFAGVPPLWVPAVLVASVYLVLPPVLLSMLASGSPMAVFSSDIARSMRTHRLACLRFYGVSGLLLLLTSAVMYGLLMFNVLVVGFVAGVFLLMATFSQARLIGRLGWVLSKTTDEIEVKESRQQENVEEEKVVGA